MDQLEERRNRAKLHKREDGYWIFLYEPLFSPLYYACFSSETHAWLAWELWHSSRIY